MKKEADQSKAHCKWKNEKLHEHIKKVEFIANAAALPDTRVDDLEEQVTECVETAEKYFANVNHSLESRTDKLNGVIAGFRNLITEKFDDARGEYLGMIESLRQQCSQHWSSTNHQQQEMVTHQ